MLCVLSCAADVINTLFNSFSMGEPTQADGRTASKGPPP